MVIPAHYRDIPSDEETLTVRDKAVRGEMFLQRFCFLGTFEPIKTYRVGTINTRIFNRKMKEYCRRVEPKAMLRILKGAYEAQLYRRDEVALVHASYLFWDHNPNHKTELRAHFPTLVKNDTDLFLFCKYAAILHHEKNKPIFNKTVKKAISEWYKNQSPEAMAYMFGNNRGRHGFTHRALVRMCRITDGVFGTRALYRSFTQSCTNLVKHGNKPLPELSQFVKARLAKTLYNEKQLLEAQAKETASKPGTSKAAAQPIPSTSKYDDRDEFGLLPDDKQQEIQKIVLGVSKLRTTTNPEEALELVKEFNFKFEQLPYHLLQYTQVLKAVVPSIPCLQLLKCLHSEKIRKHFAKQEILKVIRERFQRKGGLKEEKVDPIMFLVNMDRLSILEPLKPTNNKKTSRGRLVQFSKQLYKVSFYETKPSNLRIHITVNMQESYMRKLLKNFKNTTYQFAATALAFSFFKIEPHCEVYRYTEVPMHLHRMDWDKRMDFVNVHYLASYVQNTKNMQRLYAPIVQANKNDRTYDLFIVIVPSGARGNKKHNSRILADHVDRYCIRHSTRTKLVIVDLMRYRHSMRYSQTSRENILEICGLDEHTIPLIYNFALHRFD